MEQSREYYAFISYKREDERWASWLQHKLEHYKLPANLNGRTDLPREIRPVFRDTSELNPGNLPQQIHDALAASKFLIVICSPRSARSEWVDKEIETFIAMGKQDRIIPFIVDGRAMSSDPEEECFPPAIRNLPSDQELLGANITEMGRDAAAVKTVAQMFGVRFDTLWGRYQREQKRRRNWIIAAVAAAFLFVLGVAGYIWKQDGTLKESVSRAAAEKAMQLIEQGDGYTAQRVALAALDMAYTPEAEAALRQACQHQSAVLKGPNKAVASVYFSSDGTKLISKFGYSKVLNIWDVHTGQCIETINDEGYYSQDLKYSYRRSKDSISLYDASTGQCLWRRKVGSCSVNYSPDGNMLVIADRDSKSVRVVDIHTGNCRLEFNTPYELSRPEVSPDGKFLACVDWEDANRHIYIYEMASGKWFAMLTIPYGYPRKIDDLNFTPDSKEILVCTRGGALLFEISTGKCIRKLKNAGKVAAFSTDGKYIVSTESGWRSENFCLIDASTGAVLRTFKGHTSDITSVAFSPDGKTIASGSEDMTVRLWSLDSSEYTIQKKLDTDGLGNYEWWDQRVSPDGKYLALNGNDSIIFVWNMTTGKKVSSFHVESYIYEMKFSPDNKYIVSASEDSTIRIWDVATGKCLKAIFDGEYYVYNYVSFSPDGKNIVSASGWGYPIRIWDVSTGECVQTFGDGIIPTIEDITYSNNGQYIAVSSDDATVRIWDVNKGKCELSISAGFGMMSPEDVAFSPDGKKILIVVDNQIFLHDVATGALLHTLRNDETQPFPSFSPDGKYILTSSGTRYSVWDVNSGVCVRKTDYQFSSVRFTPDGHKLQFLRFDKETKSYTISYTDFLPIEALKEQTRSRYKDNPLTPEERRAYYLE